MAVNGQAIHGTTASPLPTDFAWGRVTAKSDSLYLIVTEDRANFELAGVRNAVRFARLLGAVPDALSFEDRHDAATDWHTLRITLPTRSSGNSIRVVEVGLKGAPDVVPIPVEQPDGELELPAHLAELHVSGTEATASSETAREVAQAAEAANLFTGKRFGLDPSGVVANWFDPRDAVSWRCLIHDPGTYQVEVRTLGRKYGPWVGGHRVRIECGNESVVGILKADTKPNTPNARYFFETGSLLGALKIEKPGEHTIALRVESINAADTAGLAVTGLILNLHKK
jgi:hypothetical protein